jgi:anti-sigma-K factor RskA
MKREEIQPSGLSPQASALESNGEWPLAEGHHEWKELCALATTNALTTEERAQLEEHLAGCPECREMLCQYSILAQEGLPPLAATYESGYESGSESQYESSSESSPDELWDSRAAKARLLAKTEARATSTHANVREPGMRTFLGRSLWIVGAGIAATLLVAVGLEEGYHLGKRAQANPVTAPVAKNDPGLEAQKAALNLRLTDETKQLEELEASSAEREREITRLRTELERSNTLSAQTQKDKTSEDQTLSTTVTERDNLQNKLRESEQNYDAVRQELTSLKTQRQQDLLHYASLDVELTDLHHRLHDAESRVNDDTQYLASDRDIRELMGARNLYIADVVDVDPNGDRRKPFGRVFYTRGKSLIFYAFDLDQQPGIRRTSIYQAWAREGSDRSSAVSLGIFYVDNEANRRWALKASDPKLLSEINSVFVTVEPKGGSTKPTGKPLLHAYLRIEAPNHP